MTPGSTLVTFLVVTSLPIPADSLLEQSFSLSLSVCDCVHADRLLSIILVEWLSIHSRNVKMTTCQLLAWKLCGSDGGPRARVSKGICHGILGDATVRQLSFLNSDFICATA